MSTAFVKQIKFYSMWLIALFFVSSVGANAIAGEIKKADGESKSIITTQESAPTKSQVLAKGQAYTPPLKKTDQSSCA